MNKLSLFTGLFALILLGSATAARGQERSITTVEYDKLSDNAKAATNGVSRRETKKWDDTDNDAKVWTTLILTVEEIDATGARHLRITRSVNGKEARTEAFAVGLDLYSRENGGSWTVRPISEIPPGPPVKPSTVCDTLECPARDIVETKYLKKSGSDKSGADVIQKITRHFNNENFPLEFDDYERIWIQPDGRLAQRVHGLIAHTSGNEVVYRETVTYDYAPIPKITAPDMTPAK